MERGISALDRKPSVFRWQIQHTIELWTDVAGNCICRGTQHNWHARFQDGGEGVSLLSAVQYI